METLKRALRHRGAVIVPFAFLGAVGSQVATSKSLQFSLGLGILTGLFIGLLVIVAWEAAERLITTIADLNDILGLKALTLPALGKCPGAESIAPVVSAVFHPECHRYHVFGIVPEQGKSLLASALAAYIHGAGRKAILVDADTLRKKRTDYSETLLGTPPCEIRVIQKPENLADALAAPAVADGYEVFDHGPKSEAELISLLEADGAVLVFGPRKVSRKRIVSLAAACHAKGRNLMVVLNAGAPKGYSGYYYGYRYAPRSVKQRRKPEDNETT